MISRAFGNLVQAGACADGWRPAGGLREVAELLLKSSLHSAATCRRWLPARPGATAHRRAHRGGFVPKRAARNMPASLGTRRETALRNDLGHDLVGVVDALPALVSECIGERCRQVGRVGGVLEHSSWKGQVPSMSCLPDLQAPLTIGLPWRYRWRGNTVYPGRRSDPDAISAAVYAPTSVGLLPYCSGFARHSS